MSYACRSQPILSPWACDLSRYGIALVARVQRLALWLDKGSPTCVQELPTAFPIFPLDGVILVPRSILPLHIFEQRYREMIKDCMAADKCLAMAIPRYGHSVNREHEPPVYSVCGLGRIIKQTLYPDGRSDIVLEGLVRMQIDKELDSRTSYRIVEASSLPDVYPTGQDLSARAVAVLEGIALPGEEDRAALDGLPVGQLLDFILVRMPGPAELKANIFQECDVLVRLTMIEDALHALRRRIKNPPPHLSPGDPRLN